MSGLDDEWKEKFREILPSVNYLIQNSANLMKENDKRIDSKLFMMMGKVDKNIKKLCRESFEYLDSKGKIINKQNNPTFTAENDDSEEEFSLFKFQFLNILDEEKKIVNNFISCVTDVYKEEDALIAKMNIQQEEINADFYNCKKSCVFEKVKLPDITDGEIMVCLSNCLNQINIRHNEYTKDYLLNVNKFI
jgi:hypothetical protein